MLRDDGASSEPLSYARGRGPDSLRRQVAGLHVEGQLPSAVPGQPDAEEVQLLGAWIEPLARPPEGGLLGGGEGTERFQRAEPRAGNSSLRAVVPGRLPRETFPMTGNCGAKLSQSRISSAFTSVGRPMRAGATSRNFTRNSRVERTM